jgi:hypothetical protein
MNRFDWLRSLRRRPPCRRGPVPRLERLEDRVTPTQTLNVGNTTQDLITAINTANGTGGATLVLAPGTTYSFSSADNDWYGPNALPAITSNIVIQGNGDTLQVSGAAMRFFFVSGGPSLTGGALQAGSLELDNLTLVNGSARGGNSNGGGGGLGAGGAIFNQGSLTLNADTLSNNQALGGSSGVSSAGNGGGGIGQDAPSPFRAPRLYPDRY